MATLFLDFENGDDNHAGTSFATLADGTDGRISSTTFSSAGASFPDDGSLIGQYLSIFNGTIYAVYNITAWVSSTSLTIAAISGGTALANQAVDRQYYIGGRWKNITTGATAVRTIPGDTIRIMGSPAPTSLGQNGVWTSQALQATKITATGSTNTTPITVTVNSHGYSTGDTVVMAGDTGNTAANGTWEITVTGTNTFTLDGSAGNGTSAGTRTARLRNNTVVRLASAVTQNIASTGPGRAAWTSAGGADVVTSLNTITKEHRDSDSIAIAAGFTTGLAAYWATPNTLDLSGYQQVSFWIRQTTGTVGAAGAIDLRLCSDAAGVTAVDTISIPALAVTGRWMPVTVDLGTALGSSIQSIALYVNTDNGAQTFLLSNIIACKASSAADSLTLTSLIGKNTTGETFWGIQSINGTRVMLDADTNASPNSVNVRGYYGTSETVTTWKRETIKLGPAASTSTAFQTVQDSGTEGNPITISGGWDQTSMSTQDLETWVDGMNGLGIAFSDSSRSFVDFTNVAGVRMQSLFNQAAGPHVYDVVAYNNNSGRIANNPSSASGYGKVIIGHMVATVSSSTHLYEASTAISIIEIKHAVVSNHSTATFDPQVVTDPKTSLIGASSQSLIANNSTSGLLLSSGGKISNITTRGNTTSGAIFNSFSDSYLFNCILDEAVEVSFGTSAKYAKSVYSHNHDNTPGNHKIFAHGGLISAATDQRNTASGISWKFQPTSTSLVSSRFPLTLSLAKVACAANSLVTVKAWMRRTSIVLTMRLVCQGGQIAGVDADVISAVTASSNTWQELTITFTPTEVGVVEIIAEAWGGTISSGWVDDMTISQA
jgi:hypothetical protein